MIKRRYFLSVKVVHNNYNSVHSWWNTIITTERFFEDVDELLISVRNLSVENLQSKVDRNININDIEILSLNRI